MLTSAIPSDKQPVILQVLPELRAGGVERGTLEMASAIRSAGWHAIIASAGGFMAKQLASIGATHIELPLQTKNPLKMRGNAWTLQRIIKQYQVDLVHARSRAPAWSAYWATQKTHTRFVTTFHGTYSIQNKWKQRYNSIMTMGDSVIAVSEFIATHICENYEMDPARLRIIARGVDVHKFNPARVGGQRMADLAKAWRLPEDLPVVLLPGRITRWKGQEVLLRALAKLPHRQFFCILLGDDAGHPNYRKELEELIMRLGLGSNARMAPNTPYMPEAYMLSHVVVAPSIEPEAFGRIPVEAQAMGKPIIATDHGGFRETIIDGETGWLLPPGDVNALTGRLEKVLAMTQEEQQNWGARARQHVCDYFSAELMQHKTINAYSELLWPDDMQVYKAAMEGT